MSISSFGRRRFMAFAGAAVLTGCSAKSRFSVSLQPEAAAGVQPLFVATSRAADPAPIAYGKERANRLSFAQLSISVPHAHQAGNIELPPSNTVDPAKHFALVGAKTLPGADSFVRAVQRDAAQSSEEAVLFVHGYNNNFSDSVYRHAQIAWDYELRGPQIHFAWPSAAHPLEYAYDRDSVLIARDHLATLLRTLLHKNGLRLSLVGHSMGSLLIMEALRQIGLTDRQGTIDKLASVTLVSPDIDMDLFRSQAASLGRLPQPFIVAVAQNDRLLGLASGLSGGAARLGSVEDLDQLEALGISTIDMTGLGNGGNNHFLPGTSSAAIALIKGLREAAPGPLSTLTLGPVNITLSR